MHGCCKKLKKHKEQQLHFPEESFILLETQREKKDCKK